MLARCAAPMMHYFHLSPSYSACNITLHIYSLWCFRASLKALSKNCSLGPLWIHCLKTVLVLTWFLFLGNINFFFLNKPFIYKKISHLQDWLISWKKKNFGNISQKKLSYFGKGMEFNYLFLPNHQYSFLYYQIIQKIKMKKMLLQFSFSYFFHAKTPI